MAREKYTVEFMIRSSPAILFNFLTTPSGLTQWFSETCDVTEDVYIFGWDGFEETAILEEYVEHDLVKYRWEDADDADEFFQFEISKSEISNDTVLTVTDFAEDDEIEDQSLLWLSQLEQLSRSVGGA